jgi:hypothetical protein
VTLDEIDRTLARFNQAVEVMTANLFELESDPNRKLLDTATLSGVTAGRWTEASRSLSQLWQWFTLFKDVVERARALRGTKTRVSPDTQRQLDELVNGASILLSAEQIPLSRRALLGPTQTTVSCRPDELLARMSEAFDQAKTVVSATAQAWNDLLPRLEQNETALADMEKLAAALGERNVPELAAIRSRLDSQSNLLTTDPLAIDPATVQSLEPELAAVRRDLDELARLRDGLNAQLDQARALLGELERAIQEGRQAHEETMVKIASATVPEPLPPDAELAGRLDRVAALGADHQWRAARGQLTQWTAQTTRRLAEAQQAVAANRAPLEERNELRGRLEAYRAKANRVGLLENAAVVATYEQARQVLYNAPTDLGVAAGLVRRYQQALAAPNPPQVPT